MGSNPTFRTKISAGNFALSKRAPSEAEGRSAPKGPIPARPNEVSRGAKPSELPTGWCCYLLLCADGSYYCGIASDLNIRLQHHAAGKGGKHSRAVRPRGLVWYEAHPNRKSAAARERQIKHWSHAKKQSLAEGRPPYDSLGTRLWVSLDSVLPSQHLRSG